jgi:ABC-type lipoprotein release transport system permease subunit
LWAWAQVVELRRSIWIFEGLRLLALLPLSLAIPPALRLVFIGFVVVQAVALAATALPARRAARPLSSN